MSSSFGSDYSYRDLEAERRRTLQAEIAELRQELRQLAKQVSRLGGRRQATARKSQHADASSAELGRERDRLRDQITETQSRLEESFRDAWAARAGESLGPGASSRSTERPRQSATAQTADFTREMQGTVSSVEKVLRRDLSRCYPDDLIALTDRASALSDAKSVGQLRESRLEFESALAASIERQKESARRETARARLSALASDALPAERSGLLVAIEAAIDPETLTAQVKAALARADQVRARDAVAEAAAAALHEIGCEVGEEFVSQLTGRGESLSAFADRQRTGYGLLIRLSIDGTRFQAAVVRREGVGANAEHDTQMQRDFCATGLPVITSELQDKGVSLSTTHRLEPGQRPPGQVPAHLWPTTSQQGSEATPRRRRKSRPTEQQRERAREH